MDENGWAMFDIEKITVFFSIRHTLYNKLGFGDAGVHV